MPLPKDPTKHAAYIQKLRDSHKGKEPGNKGKPSPFKGKTYEEIGRGPSPLIGIPRTEEDIEKIRLGNKQHCLQLGIVREPERDSTQLRVFNKIVKKRDNYTCQ